jgi:hypothetical protein
MWAEGVNSDCLFLKSQVPNDLNKTLLLCYGKFMLGDHLDFVLIASVTVNFNNCPPSIWKSILNKIKFAG